MSDELTPILRMTIPAAASSPWDSKINNNFELLDALVGGMISIPGQLQGVWLNGTAYTVGQTVCEPKTGVFYQCEVNHTSASSGTFSADRTANPTYWTLVSTSNSNGEQLAFSYAGDYTGTTLDFDDVFEDGYDYRLLFEIIGITGTPTTLSIQAFASSVINSSYQHITNYYDTSADTRNVDRNAGTGTNVPIFPASLNGATEAYFDIFLQNPANSDSPFSGWFRGVALYSGALHLAEGAFGRGTHDGYDGLRFLFGASATYSYRLRAMRIPSWAF